MAVERAEDKPEPVQLLGWLDPASAGGDSSAAAHAALTCKLRRPSGDAWRPTRTLVLARDGYRCHDCAAPANVVDHITPIARGGSDHPSNLQALRAACNSAKGDR